MRRHRVAVPIILAVAVVAGFLAIFSLWVKRQALDTDNWTDTSGQLLEDRAIQQALGTYLTTQLFSNVDVAGELQQRLPAQLKGLAGPAAAGLKQLAEQRMPRFLARPRVQDAWVAANRSAHTQLLNVIDDKGNQAISTANGEVVLDTRQMIQQLADDVGVKAQVPQLPPKVGQLVILKSQNLATSQDIAKAVRGLSIIFTAISLLLFALAVWLAQGWRRETLRNVGWCFVGLGVAALLIRRVVNNRVVDGLVQADSVKEAAHHAFLIGSSLLYTIAVAMIVYGLVIVAAAWIAGPSKWGVASRRWLAPTLIERPGVTYGAVGFVYLLVVAWGPTPAFRQLWSIVLIGALIAFGVEILRRQAAREFGPEVEGGGEPPAPEVHGEKDLAPSAP